MYLPMSLYIIIIMYVVPTLIAKLYLLLLIGHMCVIFIQKLKIRCKKKNKNLFYFDNT